MAQCASSSMVATATLQGDPPARETLGMFPTRTVVLLQTTAVHIIYRQSQNPATFVRRVEPAPYLRDGGITALGDLALCAGSCPYLAHEGEVLELAPAGIVANSQSPDLHHLKHWPEGQPVALLAVLFDEPPPESDGPPRGFLLE